MNKQEQAQAALEQMPSLAGTPDTAAYKRSNEKCAQWYTRNYKTICEALEAMARDGWQPIESAPKDNTRILCFCPYEDTGVVSKLHFNTTTKKWTNIFWDVINQPTHWMPLPSAPKGTSDE